MKQVSSHRWEDRFTPAQMLDKYLTDAGTLAVPSRTTAGDACSSQEGVPGPEGL